jgi:hypothetical protein
MEKKDLDKRVRALTTLTKEHEILALTTGYFDFEHHLPAVYALSSFVHLLLPYHYFFLSLSTYFPSRIISSLFLVLLFQREDLFKMFLSMLCLKPPRLRTTKMKRKPKIRWKEPA